MDFSVRNRKNNNTQQKNKINLLITLNNNKLFFFFTALLLFNFSLCFLQGCAIQYFEQDEKLLYIELVSEENAGFLMYIDAVSIKSEDGVYHVNDSEEEMLTAYSNTIKFIFGPPDTSSNCTLNSIAKSMFFSGGGRVKLSPEKLIELNKIEYIKLHILTYLQNIPRGSRCVSRPYSIYLRSTKGKKYHLCTSTTDEPCYLEGLEEYEIDFE